MSKSLMSTVIASKYLVNINIIKMIPTALKNEFDSLDRKLLCAGVSPSARKMNVA